MYQSLTHCVPSGLSDGICSRITLSRISRTRGSSDDARRCASRAATCPLPTSVEWIWCVISTMVRPVSSRRSSSSGPRTVRGSASLSCTSRSSRRRAWFSGLVMVSITNGWPFVARPSVSIVTRGLVRASAS